MIQIHHLNNSRSQRILWLLEELGLDYEVIPYQRDPVTNLAPPSLKAVHPLGKSPVLTDGGLTIAESGAIVTYLVDQYGEGRLRPAPADIAASTAYNEWLHYAEGSAMLPLMLKLYTSRLGEAAAPLEGRISSEIDNNLDYIAAALAGRDFLMGEAFTAADIQLCFVLEAAKTFGVIGDRPDLIAYLDRLHARPAYGRAIEKGGPYGLGH